MVRASRRHFSVRGPAFEHAGLSRGESVVRSRLWPWCRLKGPWPLLTPPTVPPAGPPPFDAGSVRLTSARLRRYVLITVVHAFAAVILDVTTGYLAVRGSVVAAAVVALPAFITTLGLVYSIGSQANLPTVEITKEGLTVSPSWYVAAGVEVPCSEVEVIRYQPILGATRDTALLFPGWTRANVVVRLSSARALRPRHPRAAALHEWVTNEQLGCEARRPRSGATYQGFALRLEDVGEFRAELSRVAPEHAKGRRRRRAHRGDTPCSAAVQTDTLEMSVPPGRRVSTADRRNARCPLAPSAPRDRAPPRPS